jgi:hypothetical protein
LVLTNGTNSDVEGRAGGASAVGPFEGAKARERPRIFVVVRGRHVVLAVVVARRVVGQSAAAVNQHPHVDAKDDRDAADVHVQQHKSLQFNCKARFFLAQEQKIVPAC